MAQAARNKPQESANNEIFGVNGPAANDNTSNFSAANDTTELSTSGIFHGNRNRARRQAEETAKDPNESDRLEIENMKARVEQFDSGNGPSLTAEQDGQGNINVKLKFDVPVEGNTARTTRGYARKNGTQARPAQPTSDTPSNDNEMRKNNNSDEETAAAMQNRDKWFSTSPRTKDATKEEAQSPPVTDDETLADEQTAEDAELADDADTSEDGSTTDTNEEGTGGNEENTEAAEPEEKRQAAENASFEIEKEKKEQEEKEETLKQGEREQIQAATNQQMQQQQREQQGLFGEYAKAVRKRQALDRKINKLTLKKRILELALRTAQLTKLFLRIVERILFVLGNILVELLGWTIICGIIGAIFLLFARLLLIPISALGELIKLLKSQIKSIDEDIEKIKKNREKLKGVIQSIQRKKRTGTSKPAPKFDVPQQA